MQPPIEELVASLDHQQLVEVLVAAAGRHEDVERAARLVAARAAGDLSALRAEVDRGLRTRRFLDYRDSMAWSGAARPLMAELDAAVTERPSAELVELLQRAVGHVVKVILHADDSSGLIGDLARDLLDTHARACDAGVADPVKLATWMVRFRFRDQDFFEADPVRYAAALGDRGLAAYRTAVAKEDAADTFAVRYSRERLAILDGDLDALVDLLGGDLSRPHQFQRVADAMAELDRPDLVLHWAGRGIAETEGWQVDGLYELACTTHAGLAQPLDVLALRRSHHERRPSSATYRALRAAAQSLEAWETERDAARGALERRDTRGYVEALLDDDEPQLAWEIASAEPAEAIGTALWLTLAERREADDPGAAVGVYLQIADEILVTTDRRAYGKAIRVLRQARSAAQAADELDAFGGHLAALREHHRRRPTLIAMLDKAGLYAT